MSERQAPAPRDQEESPFSDILAGFWRAHESVLAAVFVDREGECIDYYSSLDPFEAKVAGAQMVALLAILADACERVGLGDSRVWTVEAEARDFVMARVSDEYAIVLVLSARGLTARVLEALEGLVEAFSDEAGVAPSQPAMAVDAEMSTTGTGEPVALRLGSQRVPVTRVVARWLEPGVPSDVPRACFRVQLQAADVPAGWPTELTLVHDSRLGSFRVRRRGSGGMP